MRYSASALFVSLLLLAGCSNSKTAQSPESPKPEAARNIIIPPTPVSLSDSVKVGKGCVTSIS
jgi:serine-type D-Ala-D-Ala carboxypeptidase/endopeptidase (penicillin-binding protein 4)